MPSTATAGRIEANDVDELQRLVRPWDVILRQMSPGRLHARMDFVQVNGDTVCQHFPGKLDSSFDPHRSAREDPRFASMKKKFLLGLCAFFSCKKNNFF